MRPSEHANLLSILVWTYAVLHGLTLALLTLFVSLAGLGAYLSITDENNADVSADVRIAIIFFGGFAVMLGLGVICVVSNIRMAKELRGSPLPSSKSLIVGSVLNLFSFICGGVFLRSLWRLAFTGSGLPYRLVERPF